MKLTDRYLYLHGFASSPQSAKAQYLRDRLAEQNLDLILPDLNQDDFRNLTLSRQINQVGELLQQSATTVTLIGSSFGGLTAAWVAETHSQVTQLVLLAPAFQFLPHWLSKLGEATVDRWQREGELAVYHYGHQESLPLSYNFVSDAAQYSESELRRSLPTLILHGQADDVVPVQVSRDYAATRPWVKLVELDSDHALTNVLPRIWQDIQEF